MAMDFSSEKPIYLQIADRVCDGILRGDYAEGGRAPSVRELAARAEVNVNTVARAFEWLQGRGVLATRRGLGNFVSEGARAAVAGLRRQEFFSEQLPGLFRSMERLGITMAEVEREYGKTTQTTINDKHETEL